MDPIVDIPTISVLTRAVKPVVFRDEEYSEFFLRASAAKVVLLGSSTYGTHEFYRERSWITKKLIQNHNFNAIAIDGDWPAAYRVNRYILGASEDNSPQEALENFRGFPAWLWRNMDVLVFIEWLQKHNQRAQKPVGFYGLDLYSKQSTIQRMLNFLDKVEPEAGRRARYRCGCMDYFHEDMGCYGYAENFGLKTGREDEIVDDLTTMLRHLAAIDARHGKMLQDDFFLAEEHRSLLGKARTYYRAMFHGDSDFRSLRCQHLAHTLERLTQHLGEKAKIVIWAQTSLSGDAKATELASRGEVNLGQLVKEKLGADCVSLCFTTYSGELTAASYWDGPAEKQPLSRALASSYESIFHETGIQDFLLSMKDDPAVTMALSRPRLHRAIGPIYRTDSERQSHYFECRFASQFDYVLHFDRTRSLVPLEKTSGWDPRVTPELFSPAV